MAIAPFKINSFGGWDEVGRTPKPQMSEDQRHRPCGDFHFVPIDFGDPQTLHLVAFLASWNTIQGEPGVMDRRPYQPNITADWYVFVHPPKLLGKSTGKNKLRCLYGYGSK